MHTIEIILYTRSTAITSNSKSTVIILYTKSTVIKLKTKSKSNNTQH